MEGRIYCLLGGCRYLCKRTRAAYMERSDARDRDKSLVSQVDESKGMVRQARDRKCNTRDEAIRGINDEMNYMGEEIQRDRNQNLRSIGKNWYQDQYQGYHWGSDVQFHPPRFDPFRVWYLQLAPNGEGHIKIR